MPLTLEQARQGITDFVTAIGVDPVAADGLVGTLTKGKVYEAWCLTELIARLHVKDGLDIEYLGGQVLALKASHGPINANYPHFILRRGGHVIGELWTDIEVGTLSAARLGNYAGDRHEQDLVIVAPGVAGTPSHDEVLLVVECKASTYSKALLREILGVRRELSLLSDINATVFTEWPQAAVPAQPASAVVVFSTDPDVEDYQPAGDVFGILFCHLPM